MKNTTITEQETENSVEVINGFEIDSSTPMPTRTNRRASKYDEVLQKLKLNQSFVVEASKRPTIMLRKEKLDAQMRDPVTFEGGYNLATFSVTPDDKAYKEGVQLFRIYRVEPISAERYRAKMEKRASKKASKQPETVEA